MKKITKRTIAIIATLVFAFGCLGTAIAAPAGGWGSKGIILFPGPDGAEGTTDDIKFDSADLDTIYSEVTDGKTAIANAIKNDAGLSLADPADTVSNIYTFQELVTGVNPWDDIASGVGKLTYDSSTGSYSARATQSSEYAAVNSIESLDQAIARDNISYSLEHLPEILDTDEGKEYLKNHTAAIPKWSGSRTASMYVTVKGCKTLHFDQIKFVGYSLPAEWSETTFWAIYSYDMNTESNISTLRHSKNTVGANRNETLNNFDFDLTAFDEEIETVKITMKIDSNASNSSQHGSFTVYGIQAY